MSEYPKTENLFTRDSDTHKLNLGDLRRVQFGQIARWLVTEKIAGTNIRVCLHWTANSLGALVPVASVRGRSDAANLPGDFVKSALGVEGGFDLTAKLTNLACELLGVDWEALKADPVTLIAYGEGYGPGIQKVGRGYTDRKRLRLFDVTTRKVTSSEGGTYWRPWCDVETAAKFLDVETVPLLSSGAPLDRVVAFVQGAEHSQVALEEKPDGVDAAPIEGVIARTNPYLFDSRGNRILFKLKGYDLP